MKFRLLRWTLLLFVFLIPFGTKKFLFDFSTPFRNFYTSEYTSAFLYGSDILFFLCFFLLMFSKPLSWWKEWRKEQLGKFKAPLFFLALFLIFSAISLISASYFSFGIYSFGRLALGVLIALMVGAALKANILRFKEIAVAISLAAVFQAVVGFLQFAFQKSVGLWFLGETVFGPGTPGIARIAVDGAQFARAYGTMPHANILAGFLVLGLLSLFYLFLREEKLIFKSLQTAGIFVILTGLFLTFSRSGWITAATAILLLVVWELFADKERRRKVIYLSSLLFFICFLLFVFLGWAISPRAHLSSDEGPVSDRWNYNKIGAELILSRPLGVGVGNQLFYSFRSGLFEKYGLINQGQWQPIHNLYLIIGSEIGILGLAAFLVFLALLLISNFKFLISNQFQISKSEVLTSATMFFALLLFGLFDHFLWDLQLGRLMFWAVLGILLGVSSRNIKP